MTTMGSQITSLTVLYSTVYSDADQRKHQSSASLAFVWGIHRDRWIPRTKGQLRGKCFHLTTSSCYIFMVTPFFVGRGLVNHCWAEFIKIYFHGRQCPFSLYRQRHRDLIVITKMYFKSCWKRSLKAISTLRWPVTGFVIRRVFMFCWNSAFTERGIERIKQKVISEYDHWFDK